MMDEMKYGFLPAKQWLCHHCFSIYYLELCLGWSEKSINVCCCCLKTKKEGEEKKKKEGEEEGEKEERFVQ